MNLCRNFPSCILYLIIIPIMSCDTTPTNSGKNDNTGNESAISHTLNAGTTATGFIRDDTFTELLVEVQYMPGYHPTDEALEDLKNFLNTHINKNEVVILEPEEVPSGEQETYSANEIRELERASVSR